MRAAHRNKASNEALNEASNEALNDDERIIVEIIRLSPKASQKEIVQKTGFSRAKVQRIMKKLVENNVIYREGAKKNGSWKMFGE